MSLSSWRAWIEIVGEGAQGPLRKSLSSWRAWIEMAMRCSPRAWLASLSSWRAWIEMDSADAINDLGKAVALLMESVD